MNEDNVNEKDTSILIGLLFFIDQLQLYFLDELGRICLIKVSKKAIKGLKLKECYEITNLIYDSKDEDTLYYKYQSKKNTYFTKSNQLNSINNKFSIIKLTSLDEIDIQNYLIRVSFLVSNISIKIVKKIQFVSVENKDNFSYYLESMRLNINNKSQIFKLFIYKDEINTLNISYSDDNINYNKAYELIFLSKDPKFLPNEVIVSGKKIKDYDSFSCTNRRRFSIINIHKDKSLYKFNEGGSSYEVVYLINEKNIKIKYGVFKYISKEKRNLNLNKLFEIDEDFREYLNNFWNYYKISKNDGIFYKEQINILNTKFQNQKIKKLRAIKVIELPLYSKDSLNNEEVFEFIKNYCFFIFVEIIFKRKLYIEISKYSSLLQQINKYCFYDKIKILLFFVNLIDKYNELPKLIDINELKIKDTTNPYSQAIDLQKEIIKNFTEKSALFYPLLQFNSFFMEYLPNNSFEYYYKKIKSFFKSIEITYAYSISMENINNMKRHLLSLEEDFFFIFDTKNHFNFYGFYSPTLEMMIINQYQLNKEALYLTNENEKKAVAFSINMVLLHERMSHGKEVLINYGVNSPKIFFNKNFEVDEISFKDKNNEYVGESGKMLEAFIASPFLIKIMKTITRFEDFLDYKFFIGDFHEIKRHAISLVGSNSDNQLKKTKNQYTIIIFIIGLFLMIISYYLFILFNFNKKFIGIKIIFIYPIVSISFLLIIIIVLERKYQNKYNDIGLFDIIGNGKKNDDSNENDEKEKLLFYPDDYPMEPKSLLGKAYSFFNFKEKKLKKKMLKYIYPKNLY